MVSKKIGDSETQHELDLNNAYDNAIEQIALRGRDKVIEFTIRADLWEVFLLLKESYPEATFRLKNGPTSSLKVIQVNF